MSLALAAVVALSACPNWGHPARQLYADQFSGPLEQWVSEYRHGPGAWIGTRGGKLVMDVDSGATVWFKRPLEGDYVISFTRKVLVAGARNDRLSDFNMFWMASDPANPSLFTRGGAFAQYDPLRLYYAGIGGNTNTTTRFRRYSGNGERTLLSEYSDRRHLLEANHDYAVEIAVYQGCTRVTLDGETVFSYRDPEPLKEGYFGFRTTQSRQEIDNFKIYQLK